LLLRGFDQRQHSTPLGDSRLGEDARAWSEPASQIRSDQIRDCECVVLGARGGIGSRDSACFCLFTRVVWRGPARNFPMLNGPTEYSGLASSLSIGSDPPLGCAMRRRTDELGPAYICRMYIHASPGPNWMAGAWLAGMFRRWDCCWQWGNVLFCLFLLPRWLVGSGSTRHTAYIR
jgi:hypothetical protein